jgi:hypothetical protein
VITLKLHNGHVTLSNVEVRLRPKEMEVFEALLDHSGQVVSKADLARGVWGRASSRRGSVAYAPHLARRQASSRRHRAAIESRKIRSFAPMRYEPKPLRTHRRVGTRSVRTTIA